MGATLPDDDRVLRALARNRAAIEKANARVAALLDDRIALFEQGRALTPPIAFLRLGEAADCSEPAVIQALKRRERARASQA